MLGGYATVFAVIAAFVWQHNLPVPALVFGYAGKALTDAKFYRLAVSAFTAGLSFAPDAPDLYSGRGYAHLLLREPRPAEADYQQALSVSGPSVRRLKLLADLHWRMGRYKESAAGYKTAIALAPQNADLHYGLGTTYFYAHLPAAAAAEFDAAAKLEPDNQTYKKWRDVMAAPRRGYDYLSVGNYRMALQTFFQIVHVERGERPIWVLDDALQAWRFSICLERQNNGADDIESSCKNHADRQRRDTFREAASMGLETTSYYLAYQFAESEQMRKRELHEAQDAVALVAKKKYSEAIGELMRVLPKTMCYCEWDDPRFEGLFLLRAAAREKIDDFDGAWRDKVTAVQLASRSSFLDGLRKRDSEFREYRAQHERYHLVTGRF